ncbi:hypothetical protein AB0L42_40675 [Streptomyces sp. NPDC052287]|uniref:hypothetical protein n=1 Tax=Streptomyces sp. NPDC052287 TaxID=3154950 RepID=UPI003441A991
MSEQGYVPDPQVHSNLAYFCQDAPAEMLLEVALRRQDPYLGLTHPNFPRHTLLRFADDPDPRRRRLALASPESTGDLAERFAEDPHELVRARAAADPRLSPATFLQLLDSTHRIREAAIKTRSSRSPTSSAYSAPQPPHRPRPATRRSPQRSSTG